MSIFQSQYAGVYDALYASKDYAAEADAVDELVRKYASGHVERVLSLGCGTLRHERLLIPRGYRFDGIDVSEEMVTLAKKRIQEEHLDGIEISVGDMRALNAPKQPYDAVAALFNVISYCNGESELHRVCAGVSQSLRPGGVFVFDCWNADAVRKDPPKDRFAKFTSGDAEVLRFTHTRHDPSMDAVEITFETMVVQGDRILSRGEEQHVVHYWQIDQLARVLDANGMDLVHTGQFPKIWEKPSAEVWVMGLVAKKRES